MARKCEKPVQRDGRQTGSTREKKERGKAQSNRKRGASMKGKKSSLENISSRRCRCHLFVTGGCLPVKASVWPPGHEGRLYVQ